MFEFIVKHWKGYEMDRKTFKTEEEAEEYYAAEWKDSDSISDYSITLLDDDGNRSIFDDVDQ